MKDGQIL